MIIKKYLASNPNVGSDANSGDTEAEPWLDLQWSIDQLVQLRVDPLDLCVLVIMNYQVNEWAILNDPKYSNFQFLGLTKPKTTNDPHQDVLFCEPRPVMTSPVPGQPIFTIDGADDVTIENLVLRDSDGGVVAVKADRVKLVTCCVIKNKRGGGAGASFSNCAAPVIDRCRFWLNRSTSDGGGALLETCKGAAVKGSVFIDNGALQSGGALHFRDCTGEIALDGNMFGGKNQSNRAKFGGAVAAHNCEKVLFGMTSGRNTFRFNTAEHDGGAVGVMLGKTIVIKRDVFSDNSAVIHGGAIYSGGSNLDLIEVDIDNNRAQVGAGVMAEPWTQSGPTGLPLPSVAGSLSIAISQIHRNETTLDAGGGVYGHAVPLTVMDCKFFENKGSNGAGLASFDAVGGSSTVKITDVGFSDNTATHAGGGCSIDVHDGAATIRHCQFQENEAGGQGGGLSVIASGKGSVTIDTKCAFIENRAALGGGAASISGAGSGSIQGNRFVRNKAASEGGLRMGFCAVRALNVVGNEFDANAAGDIASEYDKSTPPITALELKQQNTSTTGAVPVVIVK